jgi:ABC-type Mn2+/Zn2+ transport system permease subunit
MDRSDRRDVVAFDETNVVCAYTVTNLACGCGTYSVLRWNPTAASVAVAVVGALALKQGRRTDRTHSESSIAIVMTTGRGWALVVVNGNQ